MPLNQAPVPSPSLPSHSKKNLQEMASKYFSWARTVEESEVVNHFKALAKELQVVRSSTRAQSGLV